MLRAINVARYFLFLDTNGQTFRAELVSRNGKTFSEGNARLNKYLHIAQNLYIAQTGNKLFSDDLYAFDNGAVVPAVREKYTLLCRTTKAKPEIPDAYIMFLNKIYKVLMNASLDELIEISHEDSEWQARNLQRDNQRMNSLAHVDEYSRQYADMLKIMDKMV